MRKIAEKHGWLIALLALTLLAGCGEKEQEPTEAPSLPELRALVSPDQLKQHLMAAAPLLVLDVRRAADYGQGHVPNSLSLPLEEVLPQGATEATMRWRESTAGRLQKAGVKASLDTVVVSSGSPEGFMSAASACWILQLAGAERCHVLEGGIDGWKASGGDMVPSQYAPRETGSVFIPDRPPGWADLDALRELTVDTDVMLVDVRQTPGEESIPGAYYSSLLASIQLDGTVDRLDLERRVLDAGLLVEKDVIVLGDEVVDGAAAWFLLRRGLGFSGAELFPGGFQIYRTFPNLPLRK